MTQETIVPIELQWGRNFLVTEMGSNGDYV